VLTFQCKLKCSLVRLFFAVMSLINPSAPGIPLKVKVCGEWLADQLFSQRGAFSGRILAISKITAMAKINVAL